MLLCVQVYRETTSIAAKKTKRMRYSNSHAMIYTDFFFNNRYFDYGQREEKIRVEEICLKKRRREKASPAIPRKDNHLYPQKIGITTRK